MKPKVSLSDLEIVHVRGSGPGGQNRNKRMSGVRVRHIPTGLVAIATERRSQAQNLASALERIEERLERLFHRPTPRVPTRKTRASNERRREEKSRNSVRKKTRRRDFRMNREKDTMRYKSRDITGIIK